MPEKTELNDINAHVPKLFRDRPKSVFGKLLRHELTIFKKAVVFYTILMILVAVLWRIGSGFVEHHQTFAAVIVAGDVAIIFLAGLFGLLLPCLQFSTVLISPYAYYNNAVWHTLPVSRLKLTLSRITTAYINGIYAYLLTYVCVNFILPPQDNTLIAILNYPMDMITRFFTAPFIQTEPLGILWQEYWSSRPMLIYMTEQLLDLIMIFFALLPFAIASAIMFLSAISSFLTAKVNKNYVFLFMLVIVYAILGITFFAAYRIDGINGDVLRYTLDGSIDLTGYTSFSGIIPAIQIAKTYLSWFIIGSVLMFSASFPLSKRYFNVM
jgi:hypothetical protein